MTESESPPVTERAFSTTACDCVSRPLSGVSLAGLGTLDKKAPLAADIESRAPGGDGELIADGACTPSPLWANAPFSKRKQPASLNIDVCKICTRLRMILIPAQLSTSGFGVPWGRCIGSQQRCRRAIAAAHFIPPVDYQRHDSQNPRAGVAARCTARFPGHAYSVYQVRRL